MRILFALAVVAAVAAVAVSGCAGSTGPTTDPIPVTSGPTSAPTSAAPSPTTSGNNGFCGPPVCSGCPPRESIDVQAVTSPDGRPVVDWATAPAANKTAEIQHYVDLGHAGPVHEELPHANLTRIFGHLHVAWQAEHPGEKDDGRTDPVVVLDAGTMLRFAIAVVVC
ncbi:MAG: hypothetical protein ABR562_05465 [Thermoplasmatota archaeon]